MRALLVILLSCLPLILVSACANSHVEKSTMAIGVVGQQQLITNHPDFLQSYQAFQLSALEVAEIKSWPSDLHIDIYFGTWCHDSEREVPRFLKMLTANSVLSYRLIALDYNKAEPSGSAQKHAIKYTPTFVVYQNKQEIGRIIERPTVSLTADISAML